MSQRIAPVNNLLAVAVAVPVMVPTERARLVRR